MFIAVSVESAPSSKASPISSALSTIAGKSSSATLPEIAPTLDISASNSAPVLTASVPSPATAPVTGISFSPTPEILSPTSCIFSPTADILERATLELFASCCKFWSSCSVSIISRCKASYCSGEIGFPNSSETSFADCFKAFNSSDVDLISFCSWSYFSCEISPFASCSSAVLDCSFRSFNLVSVSPIFCLIGSNFAFQSS